MLKLLTFFFSKNISIYVIFNDQSFNNTLTNNISFEQLDPVLQIIHIHFKTEPFYIQRSNLIQSTLVISNSKGLSEILRDIRSSTYQVCRIEEK